MGEIINLRMARKARRRAEAAHTASTNRAVHGLTKVEKLADRIGQARREALLDGAKLSGVADMSARAEQE